MLELVTNSICLTEKKYVFDQVFNEFLGIEYNIKLQEDRKNIEVQKEGKSIVFGSDFFDQFLKKEWLCPSSMPNGPLPLLRKEKSKNLSIKDLRDLPILFGNDNLNITHSKIDFGIDIFGSCFFMLSRYEELICKERDEHDRFPAAASIAFKERFLKRPIVDEYVELLWHCIIFLWPQTKRKLKSQHFFVSCDVDSMYDKGVRFPGIIKRVGANLILRKSLGDALRSLELFVKVSIFGQKDKNPFNTFDYMMDECDKRGIRMAFYFIPLNDKEPIDGDYDIESEEVIELMHRIIQRGHEVGYHASYGTYKSPHKTEDEVNTLKSVYTKAGGNPEDIQGGRQHYLRWETGTTEKNWEIAGLKYDSTLGYAQEIGFRCGTSWEYFFYDAIGRKPTNLIIRPLMVMEASMLSQKYMSLSHIDAYASAKKIKSTVDKYNGHFTLLWHNSSFKSKKDFELFQQLIALKRSKTTSQ